MFKAKFEAGKCVCCWSPTVIVRTSVCRPIPQGVGYSYVKLDDIPAVQCTECRHIHILRETNHAIEQRIAAIAEVAAGKQDFVIRGTLS